MVTSALAVKENITIKSKEKRKDWIAMVHASKEITRWHYGYNFRLVLVLLSLSFLSWVRLGCHWTFSKQCLQVANNCSLFIKLNNSLPGYKSPQSDRSRLCFRSILLKRNGIYFVYENSSHHSSNYFYLGLLYQNGRPGDWDCSHTRLRSRTWSSEILPFQCLFSKLSSPMPGSSIGKEATWNAGDPGSISGSGRSPREGIN